MADGWSVITLIVVATGASGLQKAARRAAKSDMDTSSELACLSRSLHPQDFWAGVKEGERAKLVAEARYASNSELKPLKVVEPDNRSRVTDTNLWPYPTTGRLLMKFPTGGIAVGTGVLIGSHHVLTAGHCLFDSRYGGWIEAVLFDAARTPTSQPYGTAKGVKAHSNTKWVDEKNSDFDFGVLTLDSNIGLIAGVLPVEEFSDSKLRGRLVRVSGYPFDKGKGDEMWTHADRITSVAPERIVYPIDTMGGQSGAGVVTEDEFGICGVHIGAGDNANIGVRITSVKLRYIYDILKE